MTTPESNEMATLSTEPATTAPSQPTVTTAEATSTSTSIPPSSSATTTKPSLQSQSGADEAITTIPSSAPTSTAGPSTMQQRKASEAIGAASEGESSAPKADPEAGPTVLITLLLTTGKRHPYKIDAKYLRKRNVTVEDNDPWNLPVQTLKELILRDWRDDWEEKPHSPSAIRLISMGLELQEGEHLKDKRFNHGGSNIVHMVIKRELTEDEEIKDSSKNSGQDDSSRRSSGCCGCVIL